MKKLLILTIALLITSFTSIAEVLTFGETVDEKAIVKISTILATPENYLESDVTIAGTIVSVCSMRGCWMELASDAKFEKIRIKVRDGDMVFPMSTKGRKALAMGKLQEIKLNMNQTKSYKNYLAKLRGEEFDVANVTSPMSIYQLSPAGVKILD